MNRLVRAYADDGGTPGQAAGVGGGGHAGAAAGGAGSGAAAVGRACLRWARPLALTIAAARAGAHPGFPPAVLATELREATRALDPFDGDDHATNVRAVLSWSYRALSPAAARLFRLLGLHPGSDIATAAAASLAAIPAGQACALLAELTRAHLLTEHAPGRYACHDLLRAYATEITADDRRATLVAVPEPGAGRFGFRFDIRLQGGHETVFFDV